MVKKFLSKGAYHYQNDFFNDKIGFVILGGNMMRVIKRNGHTVDFDATKIENAILKAMKCGSGIIDEQCAKDIAREIEEWHRYSDGDISIYRIEGQVFEN